MASHTVDIKDLAGADVLLNAPYDELQFGHTLSGPGSLTMTMDIWKSQASYNNFLEGRREIYVKRDATTVWGGRIWSVEGSTDDDDGTLRIGAEGFFSALEARLIDSDQLFTNTEQLDIAWNLINFTQTKTDGNLGITRGSATPSGITRTMKYRWWERVTIAEALQNLAALENGFDLDIGPDKVWRTWYPQRGVDRTGTHTFQLDVNVSNIYQLRDARDVITDVSAIGGGDGAATCIAVASDATQRTAFKRMERAVDFGDIKHFNTLQAKANKHLALHKTSTSQPQFGVVVSSPDPTTYDVGDKVTVVANAGFFNINAAHRIIAREYHIAQSGREVVTVHLDERLTV